MREYLSYHRWFFDHRDELQLSPASAALHVDIEHAPEQLRPAQARGLSVRMFAIPRRRGLRLRRHGHHLRSQFGIRREHPVKPDQVQPWPGHQRRQPLHEFHRRQHDVGGAVAPRCFEFEDYIAFAVDGEPFVGDRRAGDVAAQLFYPFAVRILRGQGRIKSAICKYLF